MFLFTLSSDQCKINPIFHCCKIIGFPLVISVNTCYVEDLVQFWYHRPGCEGLGCQIQTGAAAGSLRPPQSGARRGGEGLRGHGDNHTELSRCATYVVFSRHMRETSFNICIKVDFLLLVGNINFYNKLSCRVTGIIFQTKTAWYKYIRKKFIEIFRFETEIAVWKKISGIAFHKYCPGGVFVYKECATIIIHSI